MEFEKDIEILIVVVKRLGYVCNPRSLKEGTETSRRMTDKLGSRLERPIHFECKLKEPMHIGMRLLHPAAADHSVSISRQQVQCIFRFSLSRDPVAQRWYSSHGDGTWLRSPSVLLPIWGENTGGNRFHTKAREPCKHVRGRPARSSTNICQRGATSQHAGGRHTSCRVSSQPERARHTLCLISQGDGVHYPVGHPLLGDGIPFLPASVADKELIWGPEALRPVNVVSQCSDGTSKARAGSASFGGSACRLTTWLWRE